MMSFLASFFGSLFAGLGWGVLAIAVAAALAIWVFGRVLPSWVAPLVIAVLCFAFIGSNAAKDAQIVATERKAEAAEAREQKLIGDIATSRANALTAINLMSAARQTAVAEIDSRNQEELRHALEENRRRAGDPARYGMRFTGARCPADRGSMSAAAATASVGAATEQGVEVAPDARRAVSDLREEILTDLQALKAMADWAQTK